MQCWRGARPMLATRARRAPTPSAPRPLRTRRVPRAQRLRATARVVPDRPREARCGFEIRRPCRAPSRFGRKRVAKGCGCAAKGCSQRLRRGEQCRCHAGDDVLPARPLLAQLLTSRGCERIELRATIVLRRAPFGCEQPTILESIEGGVDRALLDRQMAARDLFNAEENSVAVLRAEGERFEDE